LLTGLTKTMAAGLARRKLDGPEPLEIDVAVVARPPRLRTPLGVVRAFFSLVKGLFITLYYFVRPSTVVTQQYPENRPTLRMFDRYRAQLRFTFDDQGFHRCAACKVCASACPNGSILIEVRKGEVTKKPEIVHYVWRVDTCTFCNACVMACPHDAIEFTGSFESAVYDRRLLVYNLNRYAGPSQKQTAKVEDAAEREALKTPVERYSGNVPAAGTELPGIPPLGRPRPGTEPPRPAGAKPDTPEKKDGPADVD